METNTKSLFPEPEVSLCGGGVLFCLPFCSSYASIFRFLIINGACEQPVIQLYSQPSDSLHFLLTHSSVFFCFHNMCLCADLICPNFSHTKLRHQHRAIVEINKPNAHIWTVNTPKCQRMAHFSLNLLLFRPSSIVFAFYSYPTKKKWNKRKSHNSIYFSFIFALFYCRFFICTPTKFTFRVQHNHRIHLFPCK